jgi:3-carboxy-cis,cis-muconate cycloisomerase
MALMSTFAAEPRLTGPMFATEPMLALFSDRASVQRMLDVEAALARAEAQHGVIPAPAVEPIVAACNAERIDLAALAQAAAAAGNLAIPLVRQLTARVAEADPEAAKYVHWGATSQDVLDTALVLQLRDAFHLLDIDLTHLADALAQLSEQHSTTPMAGRTWMQHALPTTFGLKAAGWLDAVMRHQDRLRELRSRALVLQFGGAAGTLASLGTRGLDVARALAADLQLALPDTPWHTQRDRVAEVATTLGLLVGTLGKMARDISLLSQTDVGEAAEPSAEGRGGSSTMPHKRNPVGSAAALAASVRVPGLVSVMLSAMVQEHERALGGWQAEWETLPQIVQLTGGALQQMRLVASGLTVDEAAMRRNLDTTRGQLMAEAIALALGATLGRMEAHHLVERASRVASDSGLHLRTVLEQEAAVTAVLAPAELDRLFDPLGYTGQASEFAARVLDRYRQRKAPAYRHQE